MKVEKTYTSERSNVLQRSSFRSRGRNNDAVLHSIVLLKSLDKLSDSRSLLTNSHVDTVELLGLVITRVPSLLVQHGIKSDGSLSGLTITNDQLTLTTTDRHHGVDRLEASLDWLVDRLTRKDTGGLDLSTTSLGGLDGALAIDRVTESIDDTTKHSLTNRNIDLVSFSSTSPIESG